jgi:hypothetical protein
MLIQLLDTSRQPVADVQEGPGISNGGFILLDGKVHAVRHTQREIVRLDDGSHTTLITACVEPTTLPTFSSRAQRDKRREARAERQAFKS